MTRPWRLFKQTVSRMASAPMPGHAYATELAAIRGLDRLVAAGELVRRPDGRVVTPGLGLEVKVERL